MLRVLVLISGAGSNLAALLETADAPGTPFGVIAVGADRDAAGLQHARDRGIDAFVVDHTGFPDRDSWGRALLERIRASAPDLVVLSGLMRLLPPVVVDALAPDLINTHPAYLPEFPGAHAVRDALAASATQTGASIIVVDSGVDSGPIVARERVPVLPGDTLDVLHDRIKVVERRLLAETLLAIATDRIRLKELTMTDPTPAESTPAESTPAAPTLERERVRIRRALISVSDKRGLLPLAAALSQAGVELVSTGSTAAAIRDAGHPVTEVAALTGFPEALDGRVKTLHPNVHAGVLADLRLPDHARQLDELGIAPFELVVVNLYPFVQTVESGAEPDAVIEQIDIGGPALVRAAAKNHANVAVVVSPDGYDAVIDALGTGGTDLAARRRLAAAAFRHTADYDTAVAKWFARSSAGADDGGADAAAPARLHLDAPLVTTLRYGENAQQTAALYALPDGAGIAQATQLHGKELSYNNVVDADAAVRAAFDFDGPAVAIIKHANPCGIAVADQIAEAHRLAHECDPVSAFGGVIAANRPVTVAMAERVADVFTEVLVAPGFEDGALEVLRAKKNLRLLQLPGGFRREATEVRTVSGGLLQQSVDARFAPFADWTLVAGDPVDEATASDLEFAWRACRSVKSNAILLARGGASVGIGMGQVNRVDSCHLAVDRAQGRAAGAVAASDAFFPFADGLQVLLAAGVRAVVQPGGSVRDEEVVQAARGAGVAMYVTGERHFFH